MTMCCGVNVLVMINDAHAYLLSQYSTAVQVQRNWYVGARARKRYKNARSRTCAIMTRSYCSKNISVLSGKYRESLVCKAILFTNLSPDTEYLGNGYFKRVSFNHFASFTADVSSAASPLL